jgi:hypothetical protein
VPLIVDAATVEVPEELDVVPPPPQAASTAINDVHMLNFAALILQIVFNLFALCFQPRFLIGTVGHSECRRKALTSFGAFLLNVF